MNKHYIEKDGKPVEASYEEWLSLTTDPEARRVAFTRVKGHGTLSTVFLTCDHNFGLDGPPVLYETMFFPEHIDPAGPNEVCERYCTRDEALAGHQQLLRECGFPETENTENE